MRAKLFSKIFVLFICSIFLASSTVAQMKPQAILVGEGDANAKNSLIEPAVEMFAARLSAEPETTIGFIGVYETSELSRKIKPILAKYPALENRIRFLYASCYPRDLTSAEFWLVPKDADIPRPTNCGECICPVASVSVVEIADSTGGNLTFTAHVKGQTQNGFKYEWTITAGKIVAGQGTKTIRVDAPDAAEVTAIVRIGGTCDDEICPLSYSETAKITGKYKK